MQIISIAQLKKYDSRFKILLTRLRHSVQHEHTVIITYIHTYELRQRHNKNINIGEKKHYE
jgi:hypothetical protein